MNMSISSQLGQATANHTIEKVAFLGSIRENSLMESLGEGALGGSIGGGIGYGLGTGAGVSASNRLADALQAPKASVIRAMLKAMPKGLAGGALGGLGLGGLLHLLAGGPNKARSREIADRAGRLQEMWRR